MEEQQFENQKMAKFFNKEHDATKYLQENQDNYKISRQYSNGRGYEYICVPKNQLCQFFREYRKQGLYDCAQQGYQKKVFFDIDNAQREFKVQELKDFVELFYKRSGNVDLQRDYSIQDSSRTKDGKFKGSYHIIIHNIFFAYANQIKQQIFDQLFGSSIEDHKQEELQNQREILELLDLSVYSVNRQFRFCFSKKQESLDIPESYLRPIFSTRKYENYSDQYFYDHLICGELIDKNCLQNCSFKSRCDNCYKNAQISQKFQDVENFYLSSKKGERKINDLIVQRNNQNFRINQEIIDPDQIQKLSEKELQIFYQTMENIIIPHVSQFDILVKFIYNMAQLYVSVRDKSQKKLIDIEYECTMLKVQDYLIEMNKGLTTYISKYQYHFEYTCQRVNPIKRFQQFRLITQVKNIKIDQTIQSFINSEKIRDQRNQQLREKYQDDVFFTEQKQNQYGICDVDLTIIDKNQEMIFINSETGTGKSQQLQLYLKTRKEDVVSITVRKSLQAQQQQQYAHLQNDRRVIIEQFESIYKKCDTSFFMKRKNYILVLDECVSMINQIKSMFCLDTKKINVWSTIQLLQNAEQVILLDANISLETISFYEDLSKLTRMQIIINPYKKQFETLNIYQDLTTTNNSIIKDIKNKKKVAICSQNLEICKTLYLQLNKEYENLQMVQDLDQSQENQINVDLCVGETKNSKKMQIGKDITQYMEDKQVQVFIYNQALLAGIDCQSDFDILYFIDKGDYLDNQQKYQMINRFRRVKYINFCFLQDPKILSLNYKDKTDNEREIQKYEIIRYINFKEYLFYGQQIGKDKDNFLQMQKEKFKEELEKMRQEYLTEQQQAYVLKQELQASIFRKSQTYGIPLDYMFFASQGKDLQKEIAYVKYQTQNGDKIDKEMFINVWNDDIKEVVNQNKNNSKHLKDILKYTAIYDNIDQLQFDKQEDLNKHLYNDKYIRDFLDQCGVDFSKRTTFNGELQRVLPHIQIINKRTKSKRYFIIEVQKIEQNENYKYTEKFEEWHQKYIKSNQDNPDQQQDISQAIQSTIIQKKINIIK